MTEFFDAITSPINLGLSVALAVVFVYWLMVIIGALAFDALDVDLDADTDVDLDVDADVDADFDVDAAPGTDLVPDVDFDPDTDVAPGADAAAGGSFVLSMLRLVGLGEVPLMVLLSFFLLAMWMIGMLMYPVVGDWVMLGQVALLVPYAIAAIIIARIVTLPLAVVFRKMKAKEKAEQKLDLIGKRCVIVSRQVTGRYGQVQVDTGGAPLLLNARLSHNNGTALRKGAEAVIVGKSDDGRFFTVRGF